MNWPGFYALSAAWLFALIPPLILVYFLKLKRPHLQVPCLVLWKQVIQDHRVNSPFQKFKRNILLLLQLLLLLLLIFAAMQPYLRGEAERAKRLPVLVDCSASMAALDKAGGVSRLDAAKQRLREMIDGLLPDQQLCLIAFGRTAHKLTGFTDNKRVLREAVDKITVLDVESDVEDALRLVQALSRKEPFDSVMMLSDGNFPAKASVDLSFKLDYQQLPAGGQNMGITTLSARRSDEGWDVFVKVDSSAKETVAGSIELTLDGVSVAREDVALASGRTERLVFPVGVERAATLEVRLRPDDFDALPSDNVAYLDLAPPRPLLVFAPPAMAPYRLALKAIRRITVVEDEASAVDLLISDRPADLARSADTRVFIGVIPEDLQQIVSTDQSSTSIIDWNRTSPLLEHVELSDLILLDNPTVGADKSEQTFEGMGYQIVAHGRKGPLILSKREGSRQSYFLLFHTDRSTLPYRIGFPVMVANMVNIAMQQAGLAETTAAKTGILPAVRVTAGKTYKVTGPAGVVAEDQTPDAEGLLTGIPAERVGRYQLDGADIGASLLSSSETLLQGAETIEFNELSVAKAGGEAKVDRSFWRTLALCALAMLAVEWWYFHRKPGGF